MMWSNFEHNMNATMYPTWSRKKNLIVSIFSRNYEDRKPGKMRTFFISYRISCERKLRR